MFALLLFLCTLHTVQTGASGTLPGSGIPFQSFAQDIERLTAALNFLGQPLTAHDKEKIKTALISPNPDVAVRSVEAILNKYVLAVVTINQEGRVIVAHGEAVPDLVQSKVHVFLVKVVNPAGVTAPLAVASPNSGPVYVTSTESVEPDTDKLTWSDVRNRWADISLFKQPPMEEGLTGLPIEYRLLIVSSRDAGFRTAQLRFNVGPGAKGVGALDEISVLFRIAAIHSIILHVFDADGLPTTASFIFQDNVGRIYPNPVKRLAPDLYFQPQVYRADGESILLPPNSYVVTFTGGPEYVPQTRKFVVTAEAPTELTFRLKRWVNPAKHEWYSGDPHIHAAGCSHYENPTEGVLPEDMARQVRGEHLNIGSVLDWGPSFYYQKQFFHGRVDNSVSTSRSLVHYDLEVSGFPSGDSGHLVLLNLKTLMYPSTKRIEDWPSWDLPILQWAQSQGAVAGFAHAGWGLATHTDTLPNYEIPRFDGIGANEYIVDVTYPNAVNFIGVGDTPYIWELNIWYHTLNLGFRTRIAGETDFPCIYDTRVGEGRTYAKIAGRLTYDHFTRAIRDGAVYVSDGRSHLMDFSVDGTRMGTENSQVNLTGPGNVHVGVTAAAYLSIRPNPGIQQLHYDERPYWDLERARIGVTRKVWVEVVMNGEPVAKKAIVADGTIQKLDFSLPVAKSSWIAIRILPSSHTNPIFVLVNEKPIRASRRSAEWCLRSVDQSWEQKSGLISSQDRPRAKMAYDHARAVYRQLLQESGED
jgi:hypothetical protein